MGIKELLRGYYNISAKTTAEEFKAFKSALEKSYIPLAKKVALAYWTASITGKTEDWSRYEQLMKKQSAMLSDKAAFARLKFIKESKEVVDPVASRDLETIYLSYLGNQVDTAKLDAVTELGAQIEKRFNNFRTEHAGKRLTDNDVLEILKRSDDSAERRAVWTAQKRVGSLVAADVRKLARMNNEIARELGFKNYHDMMLRLGEQDPEEVLKIFDQLDVLTKDAYVAQKRVIDKEVCDRFKLKSSDEIMPWHYEDYFFQDAPKPHGAVDYDKFYEGRDLPAIAQRFYDSIGLDITDLVKNSDLVPREGKCQTAFCICIDPMQGDIRVLANNVPKDNSMATMLHEFGHAAYDKYIDRRLSYFLQSAAHTFTTEAVAQLFERLSKKSHWLVSAVGVTPEQAKAVDATSTKEFMLTQLVFSRWSQVMYRFEKSMYENPEQDLDALWWELVEKYQGLRKPTGRTEPDWAAKNHIATSPCYYHNYLLGELFACQLNHYLCSTITGTVEDVLRMPYFGKKEIGEFLKTKVFGPGLRYRWDEMIQRATGEPLTAKYYAREIELCMLHYS